MQFIPPFQKKQVDETALMKLQMQKQAEQDVMASALHPQDLESEAFFQQQERLAELTRWQQDLSPMLKALFLDFAGLMEDEKGKMVPIPGYKPMCSYDAAKRWVDFVKPIDKNVMNGAWSIKQINDAMIAIDDTLAQDIIEHWKEYKVEYSLATFDLICNQVINAVYPTFMRGLNNGERNYHGKIQKVIEAKNLSPETKKPSLFGKG